jgi:hypothetical protein
VRALGLLLLLAACGSGAPPPGNETVEIPTPSGPPVAQQMEAAPPPMESAQAGPRWESVSSGEGSALRLTGSDGKVAMSVACLGQPRRMVVTVPSFSPIGSEDRFSLGLGNEPVTLVADPTRQKGPGVTAEGPPPPRAVFDNAATVSALYGRQQVGPVPAPPEKLRELLAKSCA